MHKGLDIANKAGTDVLAPGRRHSFKSSVSPYLGRMVEVSHGYGIKTTYGHLSESYVRIGRRVKRRGSKIAAIGSTGKSTRAAPSLRGCGKRHKVTRGITYSIKIA